MVPITWYLVLSAILFIIGVAGVLTRQLPEAPVPPGDAPSTKVRPGRPGDFLT